MTPVLRKRYAELGRKLRSYGNVIVAFSGGVDSALVLKIAVDALGPEHVLAVTSRSPSVPRIDTESSVAFAREIGARHEFLDTYEVSDANYKQNPNNRCYFCKSELYQQLGQLARQRGFKTIVNGANADDLGDYRPGMLAASEYRVRSPLAECGVTKAELREIAAELGLSVHDKPASPCLASRVPYGEEITPEKLERIDRAERILHELGVRECRVRHHEQLARIEAPPEQIERLASPTVRAELCRRMREIGFQYVTLDLHGFRSGSLNELILGEGLKAVARP